MTYETTLLGNESGTQYTGVKDKSGGTGSSPVAVLLTGIFKRGRFDKPMTITGENIRAQLGYEPKNPSYIAVQDALNSGVPSVQVLRIKSEQIKCVPTASIWSKDIDFSMINHHSPDGYAEFHNGSPTITSRLMKVTDFSDVRSFFEALADDNETIEIRNGSAPGTINMRYLPNASTGDHSLILEYQFNNEGDVIPDGMWPRVYLSNYFDQEPFITNCSGLIEEEQH